MLGIQNSYKTIEKTEWGMLAHPNLKTYYIICLQSRLSGIDIKINIQVNGIELWESRNKLCTMGNWFLTTVPRHFNGEGIVFSTNGAGQLDIHGKNLPGLLLCIKVTQNGSKT